MFRSRAVRCLLGFVLLFSVFAGLLGGQAVMAAQKGGSLLLSPSQEQPPFEEGLTLGSQFPILSGVSGDEFEFEVELSYQGSEARIFDLITTVPPEWGASIMPTTFGATSQISAIRLEPFKSLPDKVKVKLRPLARRMPEPGEYVVILKAASGELEATIELKVVVTARYEFFMLPATGRLNTKADAGKDNHFSILLLNSGSTAIENITFSSSKPEGWSITYNPEKVDSLESGLTQEVDVVINPPRKTIAGDYEIKLWAESKEFSPDSLVLRVTVLTPTIWGWVGILIVLAIIAGVGVIFWRLGRR